jgi:putative membrane protein
MTAINQILPRRTLKDYLGLVLRGFCMGASDVVPGVSGGTMAFILGIYEELIESIKSIDLQVIKLLLNFKFKEIFELVPWRFLLSVVTGILLAVFSLARGLEWLLENKPVLIWSFFFGLVLASVLMVSKRITRWYLRTIVGMIVAAVGAYIIVGLVPANTPETLWFVFLSGAIAICAMILPGISGSFILVLLGKYQYILSAVNNRDFLTLGIFAVGAGIGIVSFAQILSWLFKRYHNMTIAMLTGLMLGSLRKVWPWKETLSTILDRHGQPIPVEQVNILPPAFTGEVALAIGLAIFGFALVFVLENLASSKTEN